MSRYRDTIIAALLVVIVALFAYEISRISVGNFQRAPGMIYYPLLLSASLAAASLVLLIRSLVRPGKYGQARKRETEEGAVASQKEKTASEPEGEPEADVTEEDGESEQKPWTRRQRILPVLLGVAILSGYVVALALVGFVLSTPVMLVGLLLAYGVRSWKAIASLSVGITAVIYLSFYYLLSIQLP